MSQYRNIKNQEKKSTVKNFKKLKSFRSVRSVSDESYESYGSIKGIKKFVFTKNLENYENLPESNSCYLDGRYFNIVLANYPGLLSNPLYIDVKINKMTTLNKRSEREYISARMEETKINTKFPGLLRLVINTHIGNKNSKHSNLLILDYKNGIIYRFEPLGQRAPYFDEISKIVHTYLSQFFEWDFKVIELNSDQKLDENNRECTKIGLKSGFCLAYVLLYAYNFINLLDFHPSNIRRFVTQIERTYGRLPSEGADIEYGELSRGQKQAIGAGAGLLGGAILGGPTLALGLGGAGLIAGSIL